MKLCLQQLIHWPKLSWFAKVTDDTVNVLHGCWGDYSDEWIRGGAKNSDNMVSGSLASPIPTKGGQ